MLRVETAGLPISARDLIARAIEMAFGRDVVTMDELNKDNLRHKVRLSSRDLDVVLVVLDGTSTDLCRDIENGLYSSDKFLSYTNDRELVYFLNKKFEVGLEVPEEEEVISQSEEYSGVDEDLLEMYESKIHNRDMEISNLQSRIQELSRVIEDGGYSEDTSKDSELESLTQENLELRDRLLSAESSSKELSGRLDTAESNLSTAKETIVKLESSLKSLEKDYRVVDGELSDLRVTHSSQAAVLKNKEAEIERMQEELKQVDTLRDSILSYRSQQEVLESKNRTLSSRISELSIDLDTKNKELDRLNEELQNSGVTTELFEKTKQELSLVSQEKDDLAKKVSSLQDSLDTESSKRSQVEEELDQVQSLVSELQEKLDRCDEDLVALNSEKLRMQGEIHLLRQSTSRDTSIEEISAELASLRKDYRMLQEGVFSRLASFAMPNGASPIHLTRKGVSLSNVHFCFSGSTESRKGTYRCLLDSFRRMSSGNILIVDAVSETSIDYVFEIGKVVTGIDWFRKGGGLQPYLSSTCLRSVRVLSPGLGYINDSYFLTVDWENRLSELEKSGYQVFLYCGDLSNVVGRVLHESFADIGDSTVYVHGNAIGCRNVVSNLRGISNASRSTIAYFDFNPKMNRLYALAEKSNRCVVLSSVKGR